MIKTNQSSLYTLEQLRNAEDFLLNLEDVYYSLIKIKREYDAMVSASGPEGYVCHSAECGSHVTTTGLSAERLTRRMYVLNGRYKDLYTLLGTLRNDLKLMNKTSEYALLYLRFKKGYNAAETALKMKSSIRNYYRIRKRALYPVCNSMLKTELGRQVLLQGSHAVMHRYFK